MNYKPIAPFQDNIGLRQNIISACLQLTDLGFCIGTWGNVSVRVEEGLLITPSRVDYGTMREEDLVVVSWDGVRIKGSRPASSEMHLHRLLLLKRPEMGAVVHTHSPYASAIACARKSLPVMVEDMAQIIGGEVRCAPYTPGGRHIELAEAACEALGNEATAVLLSNHGPVTCGCNLAEAVVASQVLEKAAQLYVLANSIGGCTSIPEDMVTEERNRYLFKYGKDEDKSSLEVST